MVRNKIHRYNPKLKKLARDLRQSSTFTEILLWLEIKNRSYGYQFHRQVPIDEFIVDFFCHELQLAIEVDGNTHNYNYNYDNYRQVSLEKLGIKVTRFTP